MTQDVIGRPGWLRGHPPPCFDIHPGIAPASSRAATPFSWSVGFFYLPPAAALAEQSCS